MKAFALIGASAAACAFVAACIVRRDASAWQHDHSIRHLQVRPYMFLARTAAAAAAAGAAAFRSAWLIYPKGWLHLLTAHAAQLPVCTARNWCHSQLSSVFLVTLLQW
jgi:hypothetical protein